LSKIPKPWHPEIGTPVFSRKNTMLLLAAVVTLLLFIYLMAALLRPEWF
jgi:K+-transporting ATPase KdpF subunit